jgi:anti-anti-sigma factor
LIVLGITNACPVEDVRLGDHRCFVFDDDADRRDVVGAYVRDGLARGEKVHYFSDGPPPASLAAELADGAPVRPGQLTVTSADESYLAGGRFDPDRMIALLVDAVAESAAQGYRGCRLTGEMSWWRRGIPGSDRLAEYERRVQPIFDEGAAVGLCQYDRRVFAPALDTFVDAHPGQVEPLPDYADTLVRITRSAAPRGLRLTGEVDLSNHEALGRLLAARAAGDDGDLHVDVSTLMFVDVQGLRTLVRAAAELRGDRRLVLHRPSAAIRRVLRITGWLTAPRLDLLDG